MTNYDLTKVYNKYAQDVVDGNIVACENIILAAKRYISWFNRDDIYFDYDDVDRKIRFVNRLKHWEGVKAGQNFMLLPWQAWVFAGIFGWKHNDTDLRVVENVLIFIARKNGKSSFAAAMALVAALCDNEAAPQVGIFANAGNQAAVLFNMCSKYARSVDPNDKIFHRYRSEIRIPSNDGKIFCKPSETKSADGANYHMFIQDETHFQMSWELYNVLKSSQQSRRQPLAVQITTAGTLSVGYPLYEYRATCIEVLKNVIEDDTQFAALYELDEDDDWRDEKCWIKANPSLGETVILEKLRNEVKRATNNSALEFGVRTKNFNQFIQAAEVWLQDKYILDATKKVDVSKLKNENCWCGADLSAVSDLTAWSIMWPPNEDRDYYPDKFIFKSFIYVPQDELEENINNALYLKWIKNKSLKVTSGNCVDYEYILKDQLENLKDYYNWGIYLDEWNATQYQINAEEQGLIVTPFGQGLLNFNKPTKTFEILIKSGQVIIDDNEVVRWAFSNVELKEDFNNNVKPTKAGGVKNKKIDPVISMLEALGGWLSSPRHDPTIYAL